MLREGLAAYAEKQAMMFDRLARKFARRWLPLLKSNGMAPSWEKDFTSPSTVNPDSANHDMGACTDANQPGLNDPCWDASPLDDDEDEGDSDGSEQTDDFNILEHPDLDE